jgi:protein O-GlcNAc transferase
MNTPDLGILEIYRRQVEALELESLKTCQQSLARSRKALRENDLNPNNYIEAARCHKALRQLDEALAVLKEGLHRCAPCLSLYQEYIRLLEKCNMAWEAIAAAREATLVFPDDVYMKLKEALLLPILYDTREEVDYYRRRLTEGLRRLSEELCLDTPEGRHSALVGIGKHVNFLLAYQGRDDRELQLRYGELVHRIMSANHPQWVEPVRMPPVQAGDKIRIGYISPFFRNHTVTYFFFGWLREHDRTAFDVFAYHVGSETDSVTEEVRRTATLFRHFPDDLEGVCSAIHSDNLHVAVFLDIGMSPIMAQIAGLRLAPVQCVAWGHPVTSGLPTVDYFLSSNVMEPVEAQGHYSERLVRLPGVGVCYQKPVIPRVLLVKTRTDFGLRPDAIIYLSCQSTFKYLPDHDDVFAQIAKRVPNTQLVFLVRDRVVGGDFQKRLDRAFSAVDLRAADYCVLLPKQDLLNYWNLNLLSDVFLDTIDWSGGRSTMDAVACGLPVATMLGRFMRGRQASAILTQLGVTETIARDKVEYVRIAAQLGLNRAWRDSVIARMSSGYSLLYSDTSCISALEEFFRSEVNERLRVQ